MLFNSIEFLIFLPIVFLLYWYAFRRLQWQNLLVVCASYLFYGWWDWRFLLLITFTALTSYLSGILIENDRSKSKGHGRWYLTANLVINLLILGIYKYYDFFVGSLSEALNHIGFHTTFTSLGLVLPVGISFYTFQALSYSIDVYKEKIRPTHNPIEFFAFISFFPQLVAGPIERATHLLPQFQKPRTFDYKAAVDGTRQILWGLFKKMVIADNCALIVNDVFDHYQEVSSVTLAYGAFMFAFQIYGDFSGYSDIAIGTARLFGIHLKRNFNYPYFSRSIPEFWRRWHISLNTWFVDYIYIPLGGSRCRRWKVLRNTFIVFLLSGLWHGANWTFICWGLFHGLLFLPYLLSGKDTHFTEDVAANGSLPSLKESLQIIVTFILVTTGWIVFRTETLMDACRYLKHMLTGFDFQMPEIDYITLSFIVILVVTEWIHRKKQFGLQIDDHQWHPAFRYALYVILAFTIMLFAGKSAQFIYFQF